MLRSSLVHREREVNALNLRLCITAQTAQQTLLMGIEIRLFLVLDAFFEISGMAFACCPDPSR